MGLLAARLFTRLQAASFYQGLLRDALALLPAGSGRTLLDAGCGPGALTRLAANCGYQATGFDADPAMIAQANRLERREHSRAQFVVAGLGAAPGRFHPADVVVAASLLAVVSDIDGALEALWACVKPGGTLLVIEASELLNLADAKQFLASRPAQPGDRYLTRWAHARQGRTVSPAVLGQLRPQARIRQHPLLDGLVRATAITREPRDIATTT